MNESNVRKCKQCNELKSRSQDGKFDSINKRWRDETGGVWNGKICPSCHIKNQKENQRKKRADS